MLVARRFSVILASRSITALYPVRSRCYPKTQPVSEST